MSRRVWRRFLAVLVHVGRDILAKDVSRRGTAVPVVCHATAVAGGARSPTYLRQAIVVLVSVAILAVGPPAQAARSPHDGKAGRALTVFAAASLKEAFTTIG